jgi:hypothetical protein
MSQIDPKYKAKVLQSIPEEELLKLPYFQNRGLMFLSRCFINDEQGVRELAYADVVKNYHEQFGQSFFDGYLVTPEAITAGITTFQWLSTNIGQSVLAEALKATGYKIVKIEED